MKLTLLSAKCCIVLTFISQHILAQNVYIPDANFKAALVVDTTINTNGDDEIQASEAQAYTGRINVNSRSIADLTGIEAFTEITDLRVHNNQLTSLDISANGIWRNCIARITG